jgi:hypothetical protein
VILFAATPQQLDALHAWHVHEAAHASTVPERADHLRHADDIQRRLRDAEERTEAAA